MDGELLRLGLSGDLLRTEDIIYHHSLRNLTGKTRKVLMPDIPQKDAVRHRHLVVFGLPEAGKTQLLNSLSWDAMRTYGAQRVNIIGVKKISDALGRIDSRPVQLCIVDDAVRFANSRKSMSNADDIADFYEVRHEFERKAERMNGVIITVWAAQRFKALDLAFRNAHVIIFKSVGADPDDNKLIYRYIGNSAYERLQRISARIYEETDDEAKSESIVIFPFSEATGVYRHELRPRVLHFLDERKAEASASVGAFSFDVLAMLKGYSSKPEWRMQAEAYRLFHIEGWTQQRIMEELGKGSVRAVHEMIRKFQGEASRVAGQQYEEWKARQLEAAGFTVRHLGGKGQPDILAEHAESGASYVYACKALTLHRIVREPIDEIRPELLEAQRSGRVLVASVFDLAHGSEREIVIDAKNPPAVLEFRP